MQVRHDRPRFALGYSLGSGALLEALDELAPEPSGVVIMSAYSSARDAAVSMGLLHPRLRWIAPDIWNNVENVRRARVPVLVVHSHHDGLFTADMARAIHEAAPGVRRLELFTGSDHTAAWRQPFGQLWEPVIDFAWSGVLPYLSAVRP